MAVMGDLLDKILIPLRPQSAPVRNDHRDSISEEKCDAGWIHLVSNVRRSNASY